MILSLLLALSQTSDASITYPAKSGLGVGKHLVFLAGAEEYRAEEGLPMLAKLLSQRHGFTCTVLFSLNPDGTINPDASTSLSDPEFLDKADGLVLNLRFRALPDETMKKFDAAIERGVPIIALRTSTHAFNFRKDSPSKYKHYNQFGRNVLGEGWVSHWGPNRQGLTKGIIEPAGDIKRPILNGVDDVFGDSGMYEAHPVADATILMRGQVLSGMKPSDPPATWKKAWGLDKTIHGANDPQMPIAWTRVNKAKSGKTNNVFTTTLGAATDFENEGLRRLVVNAAYWCFNLPVPVKANVDYVDDYKPTPYGVKNYRKGLKPADHALGKVLPQGK